MTAAPSSGGQTLPSRLPGSAPAAVLAAVALATATLATVLALLLLDHVQVQRPESLAHVGLGMPFDWVTQEQGLDPPMPYKTSFISPWEHLTSVQLVPLLADVVVVGVLLGIAWRLVRVLLARSSARR